MDDYELLVAARDEFAAHGGAKHWLVLYVGGEQDYQVCAMGAVNMAEHGNAAWEWDEDSFCQAQQVQKLLDRHAPETPIAIRRFASRIVHYNNREDTTKDDVLAVFDKAIAEYEETAARVS